MRNAFSVSWQLLAAFALLFATAQVSFAQDDDAAAGEDAEVMEDGGEEMAEEDAAESTDEAGDEVAEEGGEEAAEDGDDSGDAEEGGEMAEESEGDDAEMAEEEEPMSDMQFDRFTMGNGEIHDGTFAGVQGGKLQLSTAGGTLAAAPGDVARVDLMESRSYFGKADKRTASAEFELSSSDGQLMIGDEAFDPANYLKVSNSPIADETWTINALLTATVTAGNTETATFGFLARAQRDTFVDQFIAEYEFGYGEITSSIITNRFHRALLSYRYFAMDWFSVFVRNNTLSNLITGIRIISTTEFGAGITGSMDNYSYGVDLAPITITFRERLPMDAEWYAGWALTGTVSTTLDNGFAAVLLGSLDGAYEGAENNEAYNFNGLLRLTVSGQLTDMISLGLLGEMRYVNQPAQGFKNTDFRLILTLGISFA